MSSGYNTLYSFKNSMCGVDINEWDTDKVDDETDPIAVYLDIPVSEGSSEPCIGECPLIFNFGNLYYKYWISYCFFVFVYD
jgi:hypothetical protein